MAAEKELLRVSGLFAGYGAFRVLRDIHLTVRSGEIVTIIGPNGAGKSTLLKAVNGMATVYEGTVEVDGQEMKGSRTEDRLNAGLALVLQGRCNFPEMTVAENLEMGAFTVPSRLRRKREARVLDLLPLLRERYSSKARNLSGGQQQILEVGMMLMVEPRVLMLDEPTLGLDPKNSRLVLSEIQSLARDGLGVLMVEQNARQALSVSDRGYVMVNGEQHMTGPAALLLDDPNVAALYLGPPR